MKRFLLIAGLLILPSVAHGQAFSPWVQQVLERADQGISFANTLPAASCDNETVQSLTRNNQSLIRQLVIPSVEREQQSQSLRERTVCVENDRRLLQVKIREVQSAMETAAQSCKAATATLLRENYVFLHRAYASLLKGATDPTVQDNLLRFRYMFHDQELFNAGISEPVAITGSTVPLCPYTTDYGVHSIAELPGQPGELRSFGCDADMLSQITSNASLEEEAQDLRGFMTRTQEFATTVHGIVSRALFNIDTIIALLTETEQDEQGAGNCTIVMSCSSDCPTNGSASPKQADGTINICVNPNRTPAHLTPYVLKHERVHAEQLCSKPVGFDAPDLATCCAMEHEAHLVECNAYAADGLLPPSVNGIPMTVELCAASGANGSCQNRGGLCFEGIPELPDAVAYVVATPQQIQDLNLPSSCEEAIAETAISHAALSGCLKPTAPDLKTATPLDVESVLAAYPDYFEAYNLRDDGEGDTTHDPLPGQELPLRMLHIPSADFFLVQPNAASTARSYVDKRARDGEARLLPLQLTSEVFDSFLIAIFRGTDAISSMKTIQANIESETAIFDLGNHDAMQRMQAASVPLEDAVNSFIDITEEFLPKEYTPQLAFFLARSCVDGNCQRTLDAVARRTFNPYCHPYVSGLYTEEDAAKKCFCDPEMEQKDPGFWKDFCSPDFTENQERYDALEPTLIPACVEPKRAALPPGPSEDPVCTGCSVSISCSASCNGFDAFTFPKQPDGSIEICVAEGNGPLVGLTPYLILHELVHAEQACPQPVGFGGPLTDFPTCCSLEREAYLAQCSAMAADGLMKPSVNGKAITPEVCADVGSNVSCASFGTCFPTNVSLAELAEALTPTQEQMDALGLPRSCGEAVNSLDARSQSLKESICSQ